MTTYAKEYYCAYSCGYCVACHWLVCTFAAVERPCGADIAGVRHHTVFNIDRIRGRFCITNANRRHTDNTITVDIGNADAQSHQ